MQKRFLSTGLFTIGGNLSIAVGPLGRNGKAIGLLSSAGTIASMYLCSKTTCLLEGSVIVECQDANAIAYGSTISVKVLLSGAAPLPAWAQLFISKLEDCMGMPCGNTWVHNTSGSNRCACTEPGHTGQWQMLAHGGVCNAGAGLFVHPLANDHLQGGGEQQPSMHLADGTAMGVQLTYVEVVCKHCGETTAKKTKNHEWQGGFVSSPVTSSTCLHSATPAPALLQSLAAAGSRMWLHLASSNSHMCSCH
jgi:hypothetical protein